MKKHNDCPPETTNTSPSPEAPSKHGVIATIRESPHVPPEEVPESPDGVESLDEDQRGELRFVSDDSLTQLDVALVEASAQSGELTALCGASAPDASEAPRLARRIAALTVTTRKSERLHAASSTQLKVARSDAHWVIKGIADALRFAARRDSKILDRWPAVIRYADAHAERVIDGKAKAKRAREAAKKAEAKKAEAKPASDKPASDKPTEG
ncbi:MAG: hypothetical protein R3A52_24640 [Polyangiales bacterium]